MFHSRERVVMKIMNVTTLNPNRLLAILLSVCLFGGLALSTYADIPCEEQIGSAYIDAVNQMTSLGMINGFLDGSFRPKETLTREQGAEMLAYMVLGDKATQLTCASAPFDDVAADRWSAPFIAWCAEKSILLGYGNGLMGPEDMLTGEQFSKMVLCAFGLARQGNYVGIGHTWADAVREDGEKVGLFTKDSTMKFNLPLKNEQALLLAYNGLLASGTISSSSESARSVSYILSSYYNDTEMKGLYKRDIQMLKIETNSIHEERINTFLRQKEELVETYLKGWRDTEHPSPERLDDWVLRISTSWTEYGDLLIISIRTILPGSYLYPPSFDTIVLDLREDRLINGKEVPTVLGLDIERIRENALKEHQSRRNTTQDSVLKYYEFREIVSMEGRLFIQFVYDYEGVDNVLEELVWYE